MKNIFKTIIIISLFALVMLFLSAMFVVKETDQVVITQFGKPIGRTVTDAGLHFKVPFIQITNYFEKRLLEWDGDANQIPTRDKKYIWVDATARWRIADALKFMQSVGSERGGQARLDDIINSAARDVITGNLLVESIRDTNRILDKVYDQEPTVAIAEEALERITKGREKLEDDILQRAKEIVPQYGIELVDVRLKRLNYVEDVRKKVYERMISERKRAAEQYRSEGRGKSAEIKGRMEKELKLITSEAYKTAQSIRGKADARAISIYAEAYNNDPDFYQFLKTLETYRDTVDSNTTLMLTTDGDYYKYFQKAQ